MQCISICKIGIHNIYIISNVCVSTCQPGGSKWHQHVCVITASPWLPWSTCLWSWKLVRHPNLRCFPIFGNLNPFYALFPLPQKPLKHLQTYTTNRFVTPTGNLTTNPKVLAFLFPQKILHLTFPRVCQPISVANALELLHRCFIKSMTLVFGVSYGMMMWAWRDRKRWKLRRFIRITWLQIIVCIHLYDSLWFCSNGKPNFK